jgi:hypothetical protein
MSRILDYIAGDIQKETGTPSEIGSGVEQYWQKMMSWGKEATLSRINEEKIAEYKERLRDQTMNLMVCMCLPFVPVMLTLDHRSRL